MSREHTFTKQKPAIKLLVFVVLAACVVALDQVTKYIIVQHLELGQSVSFIPHILNLLLTYNTGAAFSIGEGAGAGFVAFALAVLVVAALVAMRKKSTLPLICALASVAGGGIGNAIDRIVAGQVTDFLATAFMNFPIFNVADIFVTCGTVVCLILLWQEQD